jgi:SSS family solute:Na+ symporter
MPEFLERRFSPGSRYVLSVVSLITFVVTKIAVGIYAGGVVFSTLLPEMHVTLGDTTIGPFWIGSILVVVLTGLYTILGGMRAVAYNDAVQVLVLIGGSATLTFYGLHQLGGWHELRRLCGSDMFNLWKPLIPPGVESSWAPVLEKNAAGLAWPSARLSLACGIGVPTSTSFNAPWALPTSKSPAVAASSPPSSNCSPFISSSFPV